tara:strand:+ start:1957 stop:3063 length:1107 start_codon:yes stop_codon:yes gene_type:complete
MRLLEPTAPRQSLLDPFTSTEWSGPTETSRKRPRDEPDESPAATEVEETPASTVPGEALAGGAAASPRAAEAEAEAVPARNGPLSDAEATQLTALGRELRAGTASAAQAVQADEALALRCAPHLQTMVGCCATVEGARAACAAIGLDELPEAALAVVVTHFAAAECSGRAAAHFVRAALLPRVRGLTKPASRALFHVLQSLTKHHPRALGDELLLPLLWSPTAGGAASVGARQATPQAEAAGRLLKELPTAELGRLTASFLRGEGARPAAWGEAQVELLEKILSQKPVLSAEQLSALLQQADANVHGLRASVKFGQLLLTVARSYGAQLDQHRLSLARRVTEQLEKAFVKKPALAALAKQEAALAAKG